MNTFIFFMSRDRKYLMDEHGNNVCLALTDEGGVFYKAIIPESESIEKVCLSRKTIEVCTLWNESHLCLASAQVEVCTQWQLLQSGHGNIS